MDSSSEDDPLGQPAAKSTRRYAYREIGSGAPDQRIGTRCGRHLGKPFDSQELILRIRSILKRLADQSTIRIRGSC